MKKILNRKEKYVTLPQSNICYMNKRIVAILIGIASATFAYGESALPLIQNVMAYEGTSLAGKWNYIVDVQEEGYYD